MFLVPLTRRDFGFFDRQRDVFSDWLNVFDDEWRSMEFEDSFRRFDQELERVRREMHQLHHTADKTAHQLEVGQPFVTDPEGNKKLSLRFDCSKFKPEEVKIKVNDNNLTVHAKHEEESELGNKVHREFHRFYTLPTEVDKEKLKATLAQDGVLAIEAPIPTSIEAPKDHMIPIEKL